MSIEEALVKLQQVGLATEYSGDPKMRIVCQVAKLVDNETPVTIDVTIVHKDGDTWAVDTLANEFFVNIKHSATLAQAVEAVCRLYRPELLPENNPITFEQAINQLQENGFIAEFHNEWNDMIKGESQPTRSYLFSRFLICRKGAGWLGVIMPHNRH